MGPLLTRIAPDKAIGPVKPVETGEIFLVAAAACGDDGSLAVMVAHDSDETVPTELPPHSFAIILDENA